MSERLKISIRPAKEADILMLGAINKACFSGNADTDSAARWLHARFCDPVYRIWIADVTYQYTLRAGYITWEINGGWNRPKPVVELEQIGILPKFQGLGIGRALIEETMHGYIGQWIRSTNPLAGLKATAIVWSRTDNTAANKLYGKFFKNVCGIRCQYPNRASEQMFRGTIALPPKSS